MISYKRALIILPCVLLVGSCQTAAPAPELGGVSSCTRTFYYAPLGVGFDLPSNYKPAWFSPSLDQNQLHMKWDISGPEDPLSDYWLTAGRASDTPRALEDFAAFIRQTIENAYDPIGHMYVRDEAATLSNGQPGWIIIVQSLSPTGYTSMYVLALSGDVSAELHGSGWPSEGTADIDLLWSVCGTLCLD